MKTHDENRTMYKCDICQKSFVAHHIMVDHKMKIHQDIREEFPTAGRGVESQSVKGTICRILDLPKGLLA